MFKKFKSKRFLFIFIGILILAVIVGVSWKVFSTPEEIPSEGRQLTHDELVIGLEEDRVDQLEFSYTEENEYKYFKAVGNFKDGEEFFAELSGTEYIEIMDTLLEKKTYNDFILLIEEDEVEYAEFVYVPESKSYGILIDLKSGNRFFSELFSDARSAEVMDLLLDHDAHYNIRTTAEKLIPPSLGSKVLVVFLKYVLGPLIIVTLFVLFLYFFVYRRMLAPRGFSLRKKEFKSRYKETVTFADVAGIDEVKAELTDILDFLIYPDKYIALGARMPKGVILIGPPGTGKTLIARALANEAGVPFLDAAGSQFQEMFVGVGASRVRELFDEARENEPCIVFIDDIDAMGKRTAGTTGAEQETGQTIGEILNQMDGFTPTQKVVVLAATNAPEKIDLALLRPGRFDRQVTVPLPDLKGRKAILDVHIKGKRLSENVNIEKIAKLTLTGSCGADLANIVNEAAIKAAKEEKTVIEQEDLEWAVDKDITGPERKSMVISKRQKEISAYHEAGHTLVALLNPEADLPKKVTIIPTLKGLGGYTRFFSEEERFIYTKKQLLARIQRLAGGRGAEEIVFGKDEISTGAKADIEMATKIAEEMVCDYGMAEELGFQTYGKKEQLRYLETDYVRRPDYSDKDAEKISRAKREIIDGEYKIAKDLLEKNRPALEALAQTLLTTAETLDITEIFDIPELINIPVIKERKEKFEKSENEEKAV